MTRFSVASLRSFIASAFLALCSPSSLVPDWPEWCSIFAALFLFFACFQSNARETNNAR